MDEVLAVRTKLVGFIVFAIMTTVLIGVLKFFNWAPTAIQEGAFQRFDTVEDVKARLRIGTVYLPAFFPQSVRWPPALIGAQMRPYPAILMEYKAEDRDDIYLVTTQTARPQPPLQERLRLTSVREEVRYPFKGRIADLEVGVCRNNEQCSRMSWVEGDYTITLVLRSSPMELVRIAESMIPAQPGPLEQ